MKFKGRFVFEVLIDNHDKARCSHARTNNKKGRSVAQRNFSNSENTGKKSEKSKNQNHDKSYVQAGDWIIKYRFI